MTELNKRPWYSNPLCFMLPIKTWDNGINCCGHPLGVKMYNDCRKVQCI
jgi:hypothetical protein